MRVDELDIDDGRVARRAAELLVEGFREHWPRAWPDLESALREVEALRDPGRIKRAAFDEGGALLGWVGGLPAYDGRVWELHPIVVDPSRQRRGVGRALVADLEERVREWGGLTIWLGTDDEDDMTSLAGVDLYPDPLEHLRRIRNLKRHPYGFYLKLGFSISGVLPDANGPGKPDIFMAKRVG